MNSRYTLATVLLLSTLGQAAFANPDKACCKSDMTYSQEDCRASLQRLALNDADLKAGLAYLLSKEVPAKYDCSVEWRARVRNSVVKYFLNRYLVNNSLDIVADVPSLGKLSLLTTDQALEVGLVALEDVLAHKSSSAVLSGALTKYTKEQVVAALVWLLNQTNLENLLPDSVTGSPLYGEVRVELARHGVDKLFERLVK